MILNGWRLTDGKAFWMAETGEDPEGNIHTIAIVVQRESPDGLAEQGSELAQENPGSLVQLDDPREGMYLKLMMDGEAETIFELGQAFDLPLEDFANQFRPEPMAWNAAEMVVEHRHRLAMAERLSRAGQVGETAD